MTQLSDAGGNGLRPDGFTVTWYDERDSHFVKTSGLRWLSSLRLVQIPWAQRVWALPFLTVLAPSERYHQTRNQ